MWTAAERELICRQRHRPAAHRLPSSSLILCFLALLPDPRLWGAFEGISLFRPASRVFDAIIPAALNNPARLPTAPFWVTAGTGRPLGVAWAQYETVSIGGRIDRWRGAASLWTSGDRYYRESSASVSAGIDAVAGLSAGLSIIYNQVVVSGTDLHFSKDELLVGAAVTVPLTPRTDLSVWYDGQPVRRRQAYGSMARQLFQAAIRSQLRPSLDGALAVEKTPGFPLRQLAEVTGTVGAHIAVLMGYRTRPGVPYAGLRLAVSKFHFSVLVTYSSVFGVSPAFGLTFK